MKLYVGTYAKYNDGNLDGSWLNLNNYENKSEFLKACNKLHNDETDIELMFQDYEIDTDWEESFYSEYGISQTYWDVKDELERTGLEPSVFSAWCSFQDTEPTTEEVQKCKDKYHGIYDSLKDYVEEFYTDSGDLESVPEQFRNYIDFASIARDWDLCGDIHHINGFVFCN